jgi:hypothetical protein
MMHGVFFGIRGRDNQAIRFVVVLLVGAEEFGLANSDIGLHFVTSRCAPLVGLTL